MSLKSGGGVLARRVHRLLATAQGSEGGRGRVVMQTRPEAMALPRINVCRRCRAPRVGIITYVLGESCRDVAFSPAHQAGNQGE